MNIIAFLKNLFKIGGGIMKLPDDYVLQGDKPYFNRLYSYGVNAHGDECVIYMIFPADRTYKKIVDKNGFFVNFPGIENENVIKQFFKGDSIAPIIFYRTEFWQPKDDPNRYMVLWQIQPDGRYWADEDGFGAESDLEIMLYTYLDEQGNYIAPFRIYRVGSTKFIGTDREDQMKKELAEKNNRFEKLSSMFESQDEQIKKLVDKSLKVLLDTNQFPQYVVFDIPKSKYMAIINIQKDAITNVKWRINVGVMIEHTDKVIQHFGSALTKQEVLDYLNSQEARDEVFKSVKELNELAPDRL